MGYPKFLILLEGEIDVLEISQTFKELLNLFVSETQVEIREDLSRGAVIVENPNNEITIYFKNAVSQHLRGFNDAYLNYNSIEKQYNLKEELTLTYSIFDYDPGSTSNSNCTDYLGLKDVQDNFYPILSYPGYEAIGIQNLHSQLYSELDKVRTEKGLDNIGSLLSGFNILETHVEVSNTPPVSRIVKKTLKQLKRSRYLNNELTNDQYQNSLEYIYKLYDQTDYCYFLDNQLQIYRDTVSDSTIKISSFLFCVLEDILLWIRDEDE